MTTLAKYIRDYAAYVGYELDGQIDAIEAQVIASCSAPPDTSPSAAMTRMVILHEDWRTSYSVHVRHLARNLVRATGVGVATSASIAGQQLAPDHGALAQTISVVATVVALAVGLHISRRVPVAFEDACLLHMAWRAAEQDGPPYRLSEISLIAQLDEIESRYQISGYNADKLRNSLRNLEGLGVIRREGDACYLIEHVQSR